MHVVIGAGSVGSAVARQLLASGKSVTVITRGGTQIAGAICVAADASSLDALRSAAPAAEVIYNCANPPYNQWPRDWPPIATALLEYAKATGAVLATCSNLYGYGPVDGAITETHALAATGPKGRTRASMWLEAKEWHDAGRIRATEVRGSDYIAASEQSRIGSKRVVPRILAGTSVSLIGGLDHPHTWTAPNDVATALVTCATDERAWGQAWHAPSNAPMSQRQVVLDLAFAAGMPDVKVTQLPNALLWALGVVNPVLRELRETAYQFNGPYVMDDSRTRNTFGLEPTPWTEIITDVISAYLPKAT